MKIAFAYRHNACVTFDYYEKNIKSSHICIILCDYGDNSHSVPSYLEQLDAICHLSLDIINEEKFLTT